MFVSADRPPAISSAFHVTSSDASLRGSTRSYKIRSGHCPGPGEHRAARVGALRNVFTVDRDRRLVEVSDIGPRGQIYRRLFDYGFA